MPKTFSWNTYFMSNLYSEKCHFTVKSIGDQPEVLPFCSICYFLLLIQKIWAGTLSARWTCPGLVRRVKQPFGCKKVLMHLCHSHPVRSVFPSRLMYKYVLSCTLCLLHLSCRERERVLHDNHKEGKQVITRENSPGQMQLPTMCDCLFHFRRWPDNNTAHQKQIDENTEVGAEAGVESTFVSEDVWSLGEGVGCSLTCWNGSISFSVRRDDREKRGIVVVGDETGGEYWATTTHHGRVKPTIPIRW